MITLVRVLHFNTACLYGLGILPSLVFILCLPKSSSSCLTQALVTYLSDSGGSNPLARPFVTPLVLLSAL
jgi:hypothetical protein